MPIVLNQRHLELLTRSSSETVTVKFLKKFSDYQLTTPSVIKQYHDLLQFHSVFPASRQVHTLAQNELQHIVSSVQAMQRNKKKLLAFSGTGISGTELICNYSRMIAQWLVNNFGDLAGLNDSEASPEVVREIFQLILPAAEYEKITQLELGLKARIRFLTGITQSSAQLTWLLQQFSASTILPSIKDELYQQLKIFLRWKLNDGFFNKTFLGIPVKEIFFHNNFMPRPDEEKITRQKIGRPASLSSTARKHLLDVIKASLAFQYRETDPVTYADEKETELFDLDYGIKIALTGMTKDRRLSLESYVGYMAFKNGIPVSYGGGWMWGQRCKIGVNIYPAFRGAESAFLFCQVLRLYHQHFGVKKFIVKPYQFGKGNNEGLKSGAFWFYYKLGFRPVDKKIKTLAEEKWKKVFSSRRHKIPLKQMKAFTACNLELDLAKKISPAYDAGVLSSAITQMINRDFRCSRQLAMDILRLRFNKIFSDQRQIIGTNGSQDWILVTGLLKDLPYWKMREKKKLFQLISLKQSGRERNYIKALQLNDRLWNSLAVEISQQKSPGKF